MEEEEKTVGELHRNLFSFLLTLLRDWIAKLMARGLEINNDRPWHLSLVQATRG